MGKPYAPPGRTRPSGNPFRHPPMRTSLRFAPVLLLLASCASAHPRAEAPPPDWVGLDGAARPAGNPPAEDGRIKRVEAPALHLLRTQAAEPRGTVLVFPGGGYQILAVDHEGARTAAFLNQQGFDAAVLEYHIGPGARGPALADALAAWRLLRARAGEWGLHDRRLGVIGYSAGGHLAARLAAALPAAEQPDDLMLIYPAYLDERAQDAKDPALVPPPQTKARLFTLIAANDRAPWVEGAKAYADAWRGAHGRMDWQLLPDGGHGFGMKAELPGSAKEWPGKLAAFLAAKP